MGDARVAVDQPIVGVPCGEARKRPATAHFLFPRCVAAKELKQRVRFVPVTTGITGSTDIEVLSGLKDGDQIVTGRYRILRALKSGTAVKVDNTVEVTETEKS